VFAASGSFTIEQAALSVTRTGTGGGSVTSSPAGIDCGTTCTADFATGQTVTLTATPNEASAFGGWTGACTGTGSCVLSMTETKSVSARFDTTPLTVTKSGNGTGTVVSAPAGIDCGTTCVASFPDTATVALHNSAKEVGDMARLFLQEFSDSSMRDGALIVRNFTDATRTCANGKSAESGEIAQNRIDYRITSSSLGAANVSIDFGGICAFRAKPGDACARVPASWTSVRLTPGGVTPAGGTERVNGTDQVTAIYLRDQRKWGLCESDFDGALGLRSSFIR